MSRGRLRNHGWPKNLKVSHKKQGFGARLCLLELWLSTTGAIKWPINIPIPTKIGSKMSGAQNGFDHHGQIGLRGSLSVVSAWLPRREAVGAAALIGAQLFRLPRQHRVLGLRRGGDEHRLAVDGLAALALEPRMHRAHAIGSNTPHIRGSKPRKPLVNSTIGGKWMFIHPKMEP